MNRPIARVSFKRCSSVARSRDCAGGAVVPGGVALTESAAGVEVFAGG